MGVSVDKCKNNAIDIVGIYFRAYNENIISFKEVFF